MNMPKLCQNARGMNSGHCTTPSTHSQFWWNHCLELRYLATSVSLILFRLSLERVADNVMIGQEMFYRTGETLQSPQPISYAVAGQQSLSIAVLKCRAFRPSFPKTPHTSRIIWAIHSTVVLYWMISLLLFFCCESCMSLMSSLCHCECFGL